MSDKKDYFYLDFGEVDLWEKAFEKAYEIRHSLKIDAFIFVTLEEYKENKHSPSMEQIESIINLKTTKFRVVLKSGNEKCILFVVCIKEGEKFIV